jgi:hypothetical protein
MRNRVRDLPLKFIGGIGLSAYAEISLTGR